MMTAAQILRAEAQVFTDFPEVHCTSFLAVDRDGISAPIESDWACKFCADGFIERAQAEGLISGRTNISAFDALSDATGILYDEPYPPDINDGPDGRRRIIKACLLAAKTLEAA